MIWSGRAGRWTPALAAALIVAGGVLSAWALAPQRATSGSQPVPATIAQPGAPTANRPADPNSIAEPSARSLGPVRFGWKQVIAKPAGAVRLASYNLENLYDDFDDPSLSGPHEDKDQTKSKSELQGAAAAIHAINPDILALQEVESEKALLWFRDNYLADMGYTYHASVDAGDARGIEQSVLSRFPVADIKNWVDAELPGVHPANAKDAEPGSKLTLHRSPLRVDVQIPAAEGREAAAVTLFVVHHKSGRDSAYWREAEAVKVLSLIGEAEQEKPGRLIAVLGDFNSVPRDQVIRTYIEGGLIDQFGDRVEGDAKWVTHESGRTIDYILTNKALGADVVRETRFIMGVPARPEGVDWRTTPPPPGYGSDHYPVVVDLRFGLRDGAGIK